MAGKSPERALSLLHALRENESSNKSFTFASLADATGYKLSSIQKYYSSRLRNHLVFKNDNGTYRAENTLSTTEEEFLSLMQQTSTFGTVPTFESEFLDKLSQYSTAPFLFVGSGLSRRYLGLQDWDGLLRLMADLTAIDYEYYQSTASGDYPLIATEIAKNLHEMWWKDSRFEDSRAKYKQINNSRESALKIEIAKYLNTVGVSTPSKGSLSTEIKALRNAVVDGIITTNWDGFLETIFHDYHVIIGQENLLTSTPQGIGEIYKIHGCYSEPSSLVVSEKDYSEFENKKPYLASKLLTFFIEHPIIFLGYSLADDNIAKILNSIVYCLDKETVKKLQQRLIYVEWQKGLSKPRMEPGNIITGDYTIPVTVIKTDSFVPVFTVLGKLKRKFPAALLRRLKEQVYDLVHQKRDNPKIYVTRFDEGRDNMDNVDVVIGVGAIQEVSDKGYETITRDDLIGELLTNNSKYDSHKIVELVLPRLLKGAIHVPIYRWLVGAGFLGRISEGDSECVHKKILETVYRTAKGFAACKNYKTVKKRIEATRPNFKQLVKNGKEIEILVGTFLLEPNEIDPADLREYLLGKFPWKGKVGTFEETQYYRLACFYDWMTDFS